MDYIRKKIFESEGKKYKLEQLGPSSFKVKGLLCVWQDFNFQSSRNLLIEASYFFNKEKRDIENVIVMCTGNKGNWSSALGNLKHILSQGFGLAIFDYNGLGLSEKAPLSYGYYEGKDLHIFIDILLARLHHKNVILWGRSMGTRTILSYYEEHVYQK